MPRTLREKHEFAKTAVRRCGLAFRVTLYLALICLPLIFFIPKFEKVFDDFNTDLPAAVKWMLNLSRWVSGRLYFDQMVPGFAWLVVPVIVFLVAKVMFQRTADRNEPGRCSDCGFDLTGTLTAGLVHCPECGRAFDPKEHLPG